MKKRTKVTLIVIAAFFLVLVIVAAVYFGSYYRAVGVEEYLVTDNTVSVVSENDYYFFDGVGTENALIFYPGANVEYTAYAPLMHNLAAQGVDCFLVKMPLNMAIWGQDKASDIMDNYDYSSWYIGGHSLGGYVATAFAHEHADELTGVIMLSAFATEDFSSSSLRIVSIYGSNDQVLNMEKVESGRELMPDNYYEVVITGGNHSQMGSYGFQKGDGEADITYEEQLDLTTNSIIEMINGAA